MNRFATFLTKAEGLTDYFPICNNTSEISNKAVSRELSKPRLPIGEGARLVLTRAEVMSVEYGPDPFLGVHVALMMEGGGEHGGEHLF